MDISAWTKYISVACLLGILIWCAGCGARKEQDEKLIRKDYVSEFSTGNDGEAPDVYCFEQGMFYYVREDEGIPCVYKKSTENDDRAEKCFALTEGTPVCMTAFSDGSLILIAARVGDDESMNGSLEFLLMEYDSDGRPVRRTELEELSRINGPIMIQTVSDGEMLLVHDAGMLLMNREGKISWMKDTAEFRIRGISRMKTGEIILMEDRNDTHVFHLVSADGTMERQYGSIPALYRVIPSDLGIHAVKDGCIYEFDARGDQKRKISVVEQGIDVLCVQGMTEAPDGSCLFFVSDGTKAWGTATLTTKKEGDAINAAEKERIYVAAINPSLFSNLIATFNRNSETKTAVMKSYSNDAQTRVQQIEASLVSAQAPDLIEGYGGISNEYYLNYVSKGVPADISGLIDESDFLSRVISDFRVDGCIYGLPTDFYVYTLACPAESLNGRTSWNVEDFLNFMERNPNSYLEPDWNIETAKGSVFDMVMQRGLYDFIDFESKMANFDDPKFRSLLQRIQNLKMTQVSQTREERSKSGEAVLWKVYLKATRDLRQQEWISGEYKELTLIGFPDGRERSGGLMGYSSILYINANSSQKEASEELYKGWLERAKSDGLQQFPIGAEAFGRKLEEGTEKEYVKDDDGNLILDDQGNPLEDFPIVNGIPMPAITEEQVAKVREAIDAAVYYQGGEWTITGIVSEEAGQYFQGKSSLDEAIDKIQKRVQLYLDEMD
ncbi:MAG: extracellular solute-binding protein [Lachnospiraceae bacterium]|nr:extracellular solute-binding protein [Lachnospiraceae bacterium]